jgi:hypothetical protein
MVTNKERHAMTRNNFLSHAFTLSLLAATIFTLAYALFQPAQGLYA